MLVKAGPPNVTVLGLMLVKTTMFRSLPYRVRVKAGPVATTEVGLRLIIAGACAKARDDVHKRKTRKYASRVGMGYSGYRI
jgi:hypothetical protein